MAFRKTVTAFAAAALFATASFATPGNQAPIMAPTVPHLSVHIEPASSPSTLKVTISNSHEGPLTLLKWDLPFEKSARDSGTYHIQSTAPGSEEVESLGLKIGRKLPALRDDLVEIPARGQIEEQLSFRTKWLPSDGGKYKAWANGPWRAVWMKKMEDVTDEDLKTILGDFSVEAEYETNVAEIVLSETAS